MMTNQRGKVFDYRALRLLMGIIALSLPFVVRAVAASPLSSISASYYTDARDAFVGMLFIVGAFLWAYNGHTEPEAWTSKIASLAAICVAIFPTSSDVYTSTITSKIHYGAAATLFAILAYFCLGPFRQGTKGKKGKKGRRSKIYFVCGLIMVGCILSVLVTKLMLSPETIEAYSITFWAEAIALCAFGVAWIVAGKLSPFADEDESLQLFRR